MATLMDEDDIKAGSVVYFFGNCLNDGRILEAVVTEVLSPDRFGRKRFKLSINNESIFVADEIATTIEEAKKEAESLKSIKIKSLETELDLLKRKSFYVLAVY